MVQVPGVESLTLIGVAVGIALSLGLGAVLAGMLYQVSDAGSSDFFRDGR